MIKVAINGIPKNEKVWVRKITPNGEVFYITSKEIRDIYYLYKINNELDLKFAKEKLEYGFKSYGEVFDILIYGRAETDVYLSAINLIFGKEKVKTYSYSKTIEEIEKYLRNKLIASKIAKAKTPLELESKCEVLK